jgi:hypothetical protein
MTMPNPNIEQFRQALGACRRNLRATHTQMEEYQRLWLAVKDDAERYAFLKTTTGQALTELVLKSVGVGYLDDALDAARREGEG